MVKVRGPLTQWSSRGPSITCALVLTVLVSAVQAGEWDFSPRFSLRETFTDNVRLASAGEEPDFITYITPGVSLRGRGARISSNIDYNFQHLRYQSNNELDRANHQLQSRTEIELLEDWLYFESDGNMSQQVVDAAGVVTRDARVTRRPGESDAENQSDVLSYSFAPRLEHAFGSWLRVNASYRFSQTDRLGGDTNDTIRAVGSSSQDALNVRLASGARFARMPLAVSYSHRESEFGSGRISTFETLSGEVSYVFNRKIRATGTVGMENNDSTGGRANTDGLTWTIGGTWTPSPRTQLSGRWGERVFGKSVNVSASHRHRRWNFQLNYSEELRTANEILQELQLIPLVDVDGNPVFDPVTSSEILVPFDTPTVTDETLLNKSLTLSLNYSMRRTSFDLSFSDTDREVQGADSADKSKTLSAGVSRTFSSRLSGSIRGNWRLFERNQDGESTFVTFGPNLRYRLGPIVSAVMSYTYASGDRGSGAFGVGNTSSYKENSLTANLVFAL